MLLKIPKYTAVIFILCIASYSIPNLSPFLIYDRNAILTGEIWRLFSAHIVHFSLSHLLCNLTVFVIAGGIIESKGDKIFGLLIFIASLLVSITLLVTEPEMSYYGGLSGLACSMAVYVALFGLRETKPWNGFYWILLMLIIAKLSVESFTRIISDGNLFVPMTSSHIAGSLAASILFLFAHFRNKDKNKEQLLLH